MSAVDTVGALSGGPPPAPPGAATGGTPGPSAGAPTTRKPPLLSTRFLRSELLLIYGRRRNWAGLAMLAVIPVIIAVVVKIWPPGGSDGDGPQFLNSITGNGLFVALTALTLELPLFLPLAVAAISSDTIAGEANLGTLRYLLTVPVSRTRMLAVKYAAIVIFAFSATLLVAATGALLGLALFGGGPVVSLSGTTLSFGEMCLRLIAICSYLAIGLSALGAVGLLISSFTEQPIGGTIAVMVFTVLNFVLGSIPQIDWLHPYLLTHHWMAFGDLLRDPLTLTGSLRDGLLIAAAYIVIFWTAAWARFSGRDITG